MSILDGKSVLVTGGTGSFGEIFVRTALEGSTARRVIVFSRDELKQYEIQQRFPDEERLRCVIGDVRDYDRLYRAMDDVQIVVHAAALKHVPAAEHNPFEAVKTNVLGTQNVVEAAIERRVERSIALSTDKASSPNSLYGASKLVGDKLFVGGNELAGTVPARFAVVRFGNVIGSRGSVVPLFRQRLPTGALPITDERMTRFWITPDHGVRFTIESLERMRGGEIFVPKLPSMRVVDLARAMAPEAELQIIGIRPGEKLHEEMISNPDARRTREAGDHYVIYPEVDWPPRAPLGGAPVPEDFVYASDTNAEWLSVEQLRAMLATV